MPTNKNCAAEIDPRVTYQKSRVRHWDEMAALTDRRRGLGRYYHKRLTQIYRSMVPPGQDIIEIGCARGDLLAALKPAHGVGVDFSPEMVKRARALYPQLDFITADIHDLKLRRKFDFIIMSDLLNDLWDVQTAFEVIRRLAHDRTRIIVNVYSRLWQLPLSMAQKTGFATRTLHQNWLTVNDVENLLNLTDLEVIRSWQEIMVPLELPLVSKACNQLFVKLWPFNLLALSNFIIARPQPERKRATKRYYVSVVIPARNEAGNIKSIFERVPEMGSGTELIFVEGHSRDDTYSTIERACAEAKTRPCRLLKQNGSGKGDAVRTGFTHASGDILMILDADLTVPPEDLARFYNVLCSGKAEFANGIRLIYPMEDEAMRFINLIGNKFFSLAFTWLLGQNIKDTLCGTKTLWRRDYELIAANRRYFGDFDPFGDFNLLFGAARLNKKIMDVPVRYRARTYGATNIDRWTHGWLLIRMVLFAARKLKFV